MFESLIQRIQGHPKYKSAMDAAVAAKRPLVLNYHTHSAEEDYCVSICAKLDQPIQLLETSEGSLEELVHVRGFGKTEDECLPLTSALSVELCEHYGIDRPLTIYLNGKPLPGAERNGEDTGS